MTPDSAEKVLRAGGSLRLKVMTPDSCAQLARAAKSGGSYITFVGLLTPDSMVAVALAGPGHVTFEHA
jgi:hypothetical protein